MNSADTTIAPPGAAADSTATLIACPICDRLHREAEVPPGRKARCARCGAVLFTNRLNAIDRTLAAAIGMAVLMVAAVFFPFLNLSVQGMARSISVIDAALAFSHGLMVPLALATLAMIVLVPLVRAGILAYVLLPLRLGRRPLAGAASALRWAKVLKPWAMAEIFIIGVAVALVKVAGMASVGFGPAFWAMTVMVAIVVLEGANLCERSVWRMLDQARAR